MAVLNGFISSSNDTPDPQNPNITSDLGKYERYLPYASPQDMSPTPLVGAIIRNPVVANPRVIDGFILNDFSNDFYEQIHVSPRVINVGNLTGNVERIVEIFNAFFTPQTITNIIGEGDAGIVISGITFPRVLNSLESIDLTLSISTTGPSIINATFTIIFSDPLLNTQFFVLGRRIVAFPYYYSAPSREVLEWRTDVIVANNGEEQRVRTRRLPRQSVQSDFYLTSNEINRAELLLYGWRANRWAFPIWSEARPADTIFAGDTVIPVDPNYGDFRVGSLCIIWQSASASQVVEIADIDPVGETITIVDEAAQNYFRAYVAPVRVGRLLADPTRSTTGWNGRGTVNFQADDNIEFINVEPDGPYPDGYPVYDQNPDKIGGFLDDSFVSRIEVLDTGSANAQIYTPWLRTKIGKRYSVFMEGAEEIWNFRQWLHNRSGRLKAFYMPTFENNFRLNQAGIISTTFQAIDDGQASFGADRDHIGFQLNDGTWVYRTITDVTSDGAGSIGVTVDSPVNLLPEEINQISYVGLKRLNTDRVEFTHFANCVAEVRLSIIEIAP